MAGTAVVYHYFEKNSVYRDNFVFFLSRAWRPDTDFFIVIAGTHSLTLPERPNIRYIFTPNLGHDFGSYGLLVESGALDCYDRLLFVNCTVRGPFLPPYAAELSWTAPFLHLLQGDVHLCGATINILLESRPAHAHFSARHPQAVAPFSHVQSSAHAMTAECFAFLRASGFYAQDTMRDKSAAISDFEIAMSVNVRAHGWNIACLLPPYNAIDYRRPHENMNPATLNGHPQAKGAYFGLTLHPYESVFIKTGWAVLPPQALAFHTLMSLRHHPLTGLVWPDSEDLAERQAKELGPPLERLPASAPSLQAVSP